MTTQQENEIPLETEALAKTTQEQAPLTPTPPSKADIIQKIISESETLKLYRRELTSGMTRPSKKLNSILYITQIILQAYKTAIYALKDMNININQTTNVDINQQVNELIKISREIEKCRKSKLEPSATN